MTEHTSLYRYSLEEAVRWNERDLWRESHKENCSCARAIEEAIKDGYHDNHLDGDIAKAETKKIPYFNLEVPTELPGVDTNILDPRNTYADASEWDTKAKDLAQRFVKNFVKYTGNEAGKALVEAGPQL